MGSHGRRAGIYLVGDHHGRHRVVPMTRKRIRYRKEAHGNYCVYIGQQRHQFGNSRVAKAFYREQIKSASNGVRSEAAPDGASPVGRG